MRILLVVAVVMVGCRQAAPEIETGAEIRCEAGEPQLPSTFPVAIFDEVWPTADGFVSGSDRWRFGADGRLTHDSLALPIGGTATLDGVTAVFHAQGIELWTGDRAVTCVRPAGRVGSIGLNANEVLWVETSPNGVELHRAARTNTGCGTDEFLHASSGITWPSRQGAELIVHRHRGLMAIAADGSTRLWASLLNLGVQGVCSGPDGILVVAQSGVFRATGSEPLTSLRTFSVQEPAFTCDDEVLTVSFWDGGRSVLERFASSGARLDQRFPGTLAHGGGAGGGWMREGVVLRALDGRILESSAPRSVTDVWVSGPRTLVSVGLGPILSWGGSGWEQMPGDFHWRHVPDASGGTVLLTDSGGPFQVLAGDEVLRSVSWYTFDVRETSLKSWGIDLCTAQALVGVDHHFHSSWLYVQRGGRWTELSAPPVQPIAARLDGDDVVIRAKDGRQLRLTLTATVWSEETPSVIIPSGAARVLPIGASFAVELPSGVVIVRSDDTTQLAPAGSKLVGVSGRSVIVRTETGLDALRSP